MDLDETWWRAWVCNKEEFDFGEDPDMRIFLSDSSPLSDRTKTISQKSCGQIQTKLGR